MPGWFRRGSNQGACISQGGDTVKRSLWAYNWGAWKSLDMEMSCLPRPPPPFFPKYESMFHKLETTFQPQVKTQQFIECLGLQERLPQATKKNNLAGSAYKDLHIPSTC